MDYEDSFDYYDSHDWDEDYYNGYDDSYDDYEPLPELTLREVWSSPDLTLRDKLSETYYTYRNRFTSWRYRTKWAVQAKVRSTLYFLRTGKPYEDEIPF